MAQPKDNLYSHKQSSLSYHFIDLTIGFYLLTSGYLEEEIVLKSVTFLLEMVSCHIFLYKKWRFQVKWISVIARWFRCKWIVLYCSSDSLAISSFPFLLLYVLHAAWHSEWGWRNGLRYEWLRLSVNVMVSTSCPRILTRCFSAPSNSHPH